MRAAKRARRTPSTADTQTCRHAACRLACTFVATEDKPMDSSPPRAYGVFKPVGHMVVSFPTAAQADDGVAALQALELPAQDIRSEEHTSELQSQSNLVCRLLLEKKKT